jgi:hypothetical protein
VGTGTAFWNSIALFPAFCSARKFFRSSPVFLIYFLFQLTRNYKPLNPLTMPIPPPAAGSNFISLEKFLTMKKLYAANSQTILQPQFQNKEILVTSETFNLDLAVAITDVTGAAGFRIYYGMSTDLKVHAMLIAVDKDGNDILPPAMNANLGVQTLTAGGGVAGEEGQRCPPGC